MVLQINDIEISAVDYLYIILENVFLLRDKILNILINIAKQIHHFVTKDNRLM
jgi:hypothetical protein